MGTIETVNLPLLGSREGDEALFQYLLQEVETQRVCIAIPPWVMSREVLRRGDRVSFHVCFQGGDRRFTKGVVTAARWSDEIRSWYYETVPVTGEEPGRRPPLTVRISSSGLEIDLDRAEGAEEPVQRILADTVLIKRGMLIHLNHLVPYFSRIGDYPREEFPSLREHFLEDIKGRMEANIRRLEEIRDLVTKRCCRWEDIPSLLDLEELRSLMESEIYPELFRLTFANPEVMDYIAALKRQERYLFDNYNAVVMLYALSL
ncbi:MAG TPA: hypothetical protein PK836_08290 [Syntrophales bacterium]|nr:hypothetical protein [Syntrophales bacterium]HOM06506.1 hypothetical protein [Syntrophales bacterium]HON99891.1 hypothetical protein [Syntrophales bacterium]HPC01665.1 hypothetical protein [Syntrophales bacterium]HPQ06232.1 hypothetical protein [Syntrophales bacterium]